MFKDNKYTRIYYNIINNSKSTRNLDFIEKHHIIPRSLGGTDEVDNLANLSPREHFICHLLLTKMTEGNNKHKMDSALWGMKHRNKMKLNSVLYEKLKIDFYKFNKKTNIEKFGEEKAKLISLKIKKAGKNKKHSEKTKKKISEGNKGKIPWNAGLTKDTHESLLKSSIKQKGKKRSKISIEKQKKTIFGRKRKPHTEESKIKNSISNKNRPRLQCPYCGILVQKGNYNRWHGENCKNNDK